jgi:SAM-dependent methyltransferase
MLKATLAHPLTRGLDIDNPQTTQLRRRIIREKVFLRQIYAEWYQAIVDALPTTQGTVLELGSGAGFLDEFIPGLVTSEVFECPELDIVLNGLVLPFAANSLRGVVMTDVLHHLPEPRRFFTEAARCVRRDGVIVLVEPWVTRWSQLIYTRLHHEPFRPEAIEWEFPPSGPLSGANGALPWIIFARDRAQFAREFPMWQIESITLMMPFRYLISGGVSLRSLMPGWSFGFWRWLESQLMPWMDNLAMFGQVVLRRQTEETI